MFTPRAQRENSVKKVDNNLLVDFLVASTMMLKGDEFSKKDKEEIRFNVEICKEEILRRMKKEEN